jgi:hypothetical protein
MAQDGGNATAATRRGRGGLCLAPAVLLAAVACVTTAPAVAPEGTVARARQNYRASVGSCQQIREARLATLGPPIFQPISGDQPFEECLARASTHLDRELSEAD